MSKLPKKAGTDAMGKEDPKKKEAKKPGGELSFIPNFKVEAVFFKKPIFFQSKIIQTFFAFEIGTDMRLLPCINDSSPPGFLASFFFFLCISPLYEMR
jgi:hypothetical protein